MILWLVVDLPLWKIWKSIGMVIPNIWKHKTCSKPPTSTRCSKTSVLPKGQQKFTEPGLFQTTNQFSDSTWNLWPMASASRVRPGTTSTLAQGKKPQRRHQGRWFSGLILSGLVIKKKIKQLRRFSQLYLFYLSCFFLVPDARYIMISGKIERKLWTIRMPGSGYFDRWMGTCLGKAPDRNTKTWENHGKLTLLGSKHVIPSYSVVVWCPNHCYPQLTSIWHEHFIGVSWNPWWSMCMEDVMAEQHAAKRI